MAKGIVKLQFDSQQLRITQFELIKGYLDLAITLFPESIQN